MFSTRPLFTLLVVVGAVTAHASQSLPITPLPVITPTTLQTSVREKRSFERLMIDTSPAPPIPSFVEEPMQCGSVFLTVQPGQVLFKDGFRRTLYDKKGKCQFIYPQSQRIIGLSLAHQCTCKLFTSDPSYSEDLYDRCRPGKGKEVAQFTVTNGKLNQHFDVSAEKYGSPYWYECWRVKKPSPRRDVAGPISDMPPVPVETGEVDANFDAELSGDGLGWDEVGEEDDVIDTWTASPDSVQKMPTLPPTTHTTEVGEDDSMVDTWSASPDAAQMTPILQPSSFKTEAGDDDSEIDTWTASPSLAQPTPTP